MATRQASLAITDVRRWRTLTSPIRIEIAEMLRALGPCSVADLAQYLSRPADTLYRQLARLETAGFVVRAGFRKSGRHAEQLFDVAATDFEPRFGDGSGKKENDAIVATARTFARGAIAALTDSAAARRLRFADGKRNVALNYQISWLTPSAYQEVRGLLRRLRKIMDAGKPRHEGELYLSFVLTTPVTRKHRPRRREPSGTRRSVSR